VETVAAPTAEPAPAPAPEPAPLPQLDPALTPLANAPLRKSPTGTATIKHLAHGNHAYVGMLEMQGGAEVPEHQDASEEFIYVLEGGGVITINGNEQPVEAGTLIFMPADAKVSFKNGGNVTKGLQVFAGPESAAKYEGWIDPAATPVQRPKSSG
jgi:quercetin dioxygenase-like cupin family protein